MRIVCRIQIPLGRVRIGRRRAVSLLELMLVMALLVAIAAMALPLLFRPLDSHRLRQAGDTIRVQLARARVKAIESGRTFAFRFQPDGNQCVIEPWYSDDDYLESSELSAAAPTPSGGGQVAPLAATPVAQITPASTTATSSVETTDLPEGVRFVAGQAEAEARDLFVGANSAAGGATGGMPTDALDGGMWSPPIYFYPDGTSSTAQVVIVNVRENYIVISLRGLTGVIKVSDMLSADELQ